MRLHLHVTSYNGGSDKNCCVLRLIFFYILYNFTYWIQTAWRKLKSDKNWSPYLTGAAAVFQVHQRSLRKFSEDKMQEWWEVGYTAQYLILLLVSFRRGQPTNLQKSEGGRRVPGADAPLIILPLLRVAHFLLRRCQLKLSVFLSRTRCTWTKAANVSLCKRRKGQRGLQRSLFTIPDRWQVLPPAEKIHTSPNGMWRRLKP